MQVNDWITPDIDDVRAQVQASLKARGITLLPNDWPVIIGEIVAGLASQNLLFIQFLSQQFLVLTATGEFLDKHATIYLENSDGTRGRKIASYASGTATTTANVTGTILPAGTQFSVLNGSAQIVIESIDEATIGTSPTQFNIRSLTAGAVGNLAPGLGLTLTAMIPGILDAAGAVVSMAGGADTESDDDLRARVLNRIRNTPMSGSANDFEAWAKSVPGVTRAWCSPNEMGNGTVTIRIMCDGLRATNDPMTSGLPTASDRQAVYDFIDTVRQVTASEVYVLAPQTVPVDIYISNLSARNKDSSKAAIKVALAAMILAKGRPAQAVNGTTRPPATISAAMMSQAISNASGVRGFILNTLDFVPPNNGCLPVLGSVYYA